MQDFTLHNRIGYKVTRLARLMEARLEKQIGEYGITRLMWCVLRGVGMEGVTTPSGLASYIGIARPAVSRLLKSMEQRGLLQRNGIDRDGRVTEVHLTDEGRRLMEACHGLVRELNSHFSEKLEPLAYDSFMQTIDRLTEGENATLMRL
ncbi:MarR family winged helix-turn-helix transcriptional regulator [Hoeflea prorocentri]|uniref:MarR family transcriptional regulator n=1 Tax=Hoeflea prorocentri TaxID=1922333 RepID=A0A9X3UN42_9HYPH|nr:MarR family transcriptional regulator [Hoeflea prorocentri]MCY6383753.1 MarR family transcriptional regulator [Hoeflea prorocentri]MDA5401553.1 MarR family transcriptional regulator [Hoeflea prorocentri]